MTAYLFTEPTARPLTAAGATMPGAYMQFYESGTTTPTDVYSDADLQVPLTNPVEADADGRFPPIYLDPLVTYRVQLYDADDVLQYDVDPYAPPRDYPPGTVMWFYGTEEALEEAYPPALWQQLDGNNGTPDGRDRFPVIAGGDYEAGDTGGSPGGNVETSSAGAHDHGGNSGSTTLSANQMPSHRHRLLGNTGDGITDVSISTASARGIGASRNNSSGPYEDQTSLGEEYVENTGGGQGHVHTISEAGAHTHTLDTALPPYVALWAVMRRAS